MTIRMSRLFLFRLRALLSSRSFRNDLPSAIVFALDLSHGIHVLNQQPVERPLGPPDPLARLGNSMHDQAAFPRPVFLRFLLELRFDRRSRSVASPTTESRYARASVSSAGLSNSISR